MLTEFGVCTHPLVLRGVRFHSELSGCPHLRLPFFCLGAICPRRHYRQVQLVKGAGMCVPTRISVSEVSRACGAGQERGWAPWGTRGWAGSSGGGAVHRAAERAQREQAGRARGALGALGASGVAMAESSEPVTLPAPPDPFGPSRFCPAIYSHFIASTVE
jgi:hypothetical protein